MSPKKPHIWYNGWEKGSFEWRAFHWLLGILQSENEGDVQEPEKKKVRLNYGSKTTQHQGCGSILLAHLKCMVTTCGAVHVRSQCVTRGNALLTGTSPGRHT